MSDPPDTYRTRSVLVATTVVVALLLVGVAAVGMSAAADDAGADDDFAAEVTGETLFGGAATEVTVTHDFEDGTDLHVAIPGETSWSGDAGETDEIVLRPGGWFSGAEYPVTVVAEVDGEQYETTLEERGEAVPFDPVDEQTFTSVTADVTNETFFGDARTVDFDYEAPEGATVEFEAAGKSVSETADGTESTAQVWVGSFLFGAEYPVEVSANIVGGDDASATIPDGDTEVVLVEEDPKELEEISLSLDADELDVGDTTDATVTAHYEDAESETVSAASFETSDAAVATVGDGVVEAVGEGSATISATYQGESANATVSVDDPLEDLAFDLAEDEVEIGETTESTVTATYASGDQVVTADSYASDDESVATVDDDGVVTAHASGTAEFTAEYGELSASATVEVPVELVDLELDLADDELDVGETTESTVTATFSDDSEEILTADDYASDDDAVATVDADGVVEAVGDGSATITADYGELSADADVTVEDPLLDLAFDLDDDELEVGDTTESTVTATYASGDQVVTADSYTSNDESVATVDDDGVVTAHDSGTAEITAHYGDLSASDTVEVAVELVDLELDLVDDALDVGETTESSVTAIYSDDSEEFVTADSYSSDDESVASVNEAGLVEAVGEGSATITAEYADQTAHADVDVDDPLESITFELDETELAVDETTTSTTTAIYASGEDEVVTADSYSSDDEDVATVDDDGVVTAHESGSAEITAEYGEEADTDVVEVEVTVVDFAVEMETTDLEVGDEEQAIAGVLYSDGSEDRVTADSYSSDDDDVATVDDDGLVTAVGEGTTSIHAEYGEFNDDVEVSVEGIDVVDVELDVTDQTLGQDETTQATVTAVYEDESTDTVTDTAEITSSNESVVTVDDDGTVTAGELGDATLTAEYDGIESESVPISVEIVPIDAGSFTATGTGGHLDIGLDPLELPECEGGEPGEDVDECIAALGDADLDEDRYTTDEPPAVNFPELTAAEDMLPGGIPVQIVPDDGIEGDVDLETGEVTLEAETTTHLFPYGLDDCSIEPEIHATTGSSGELDGDEMEFVDEETAVATVVDGEFEVPAVEPDACDGQGAMLNDALDLPSTEGNEFVLDLQIDLSEADEPELQLESTSIDPVQITDRLEDREDTDLEVGDELQVLVNGHYDHHAIHDHTADVDVQSSDEGVVAVENVEEPWTPATVVAEGAGDATLSVSYDGVDAELPVSVDGPDVESIDLDLGDDELEVDDVTEYTVTATYDDDSTETVTGDADVWSDDEDVAIVTSAGVEAVGEGSATIHAEYDGATDQVDVSVDADELPTEFSGYIAGNSGDGYGEHPGYLHTNTHPEAADGDQADPMDFTECEGGEPTQNEIDETPDYLPVSDCIFVEGEIDHETNTWEGDFEFPLATDHLYVDRIFGIPGDLYYAAEISTDEDGASGTWNHETGEISVEMTAEIDVALYDIDDEGDPTFEEVMQNPDDYVMGSEACHIPDVPMSASTEDSFDSNSPVTDEGTVEGQQLTDGFAQLVASDFEIPGAQDCGTYSGVEVSESIDDVMGLPSEPTDDHGSELLFDAVIELEE